MASLRILRALKLQQPSLHLAPPLPTRGVARCTLPKISAVSSISRLRYQQQSRRAFATLPSSVESFSTGPIGGLHSEELVKALRASPAGAESSPYVVFQDSTVGELLSSKPEALRTPASISQEETVFSAIEKMTRLNIGALLVTSGSAPEGKELERVVGIITERDYMKKVALKGKSSRKLPVREVMTRNPWVVSPEFTVSHCLDLMTRLRSRHLPVCSSSNFLALYNSVKARSAAAADTSAGKPQSSDEGIEEIIKEGALRAEGEEGVQVIGLVSIGDCVKLVMEEQRRTIESFREFASGRLYSVQTSQ